MNEIEDIDTIGIVRKKSSSITKKCTLIIDGMTCAACQGSIENHLRSVEGITLASVSLLTHKATIEYSPKMIGIRSIIEEVEAIGFSAKYEASSDKSDIRKIIGESVRHYRRKFFTSLVLFLPILFLIWIMPYSIPH